MSTTITLHKRSYGRSFGVPSHLWLETQENPQNDAADASEATTG